MKKLIAAMALIAMGTATAMAADMAPAPVYTKAAPIVPPVMTWTGFYIGGHVGAGQLDQYWTVGGEPVGNGREKGFLGGVQAGYNYQFSPQWLIGIQGDGSWANINGMAINGNNNLNKCGFDGQNDQVADCTSKQKWLAMFTGRVGFLPTDSILLYLKGGVAWAGTNFDVPADYGINGDCGPGDGSVTQHPGYNTTSQTRVGGVAGAGAEFRVARNITVFGEYDYVDFGSKDVALTNSSGDVCVANFTARIGQKKENILKFGVNVLFNP